MKFLLTIGSIIMAACSNPAVEIATEELTAAQEALDEREAEDINTNIDQQKDRRILMALGRQYEYWHYIEIRLGLERAGYAVVVASPTLDTMTGKDFDDPANRPTIQADQLLAGTHISDYEAIILLNDWAGYLTGEYPEINDILLEADNEDIIIAAYDYAPMILGEAGLLEDVKATAHISAHNVCESLERAYGAICTSARIEQDGNIITADGFNGPASWFAAYVAEALQPHQADKEKR